MSDSWFKRNSGTICSVSSIVSLVTASVNCVYAATKSVIKIQNIEKELGRKLTFKEKFKNTWYYWIAPVGEVTAGVTLGIVGTKISTNKQLALAAAYAGTEATLQITQNKLPEILGNKTAQKVKEAVSEELTKDIVKEVANSSGKKEVIYLSDPSDEKTCKFVEPLTRQVFYSTWDNVRAAANKLNERALAEVHNVVDIEGVRITVNDWLRELGLSSVEPETGDDIGWCVGINNDLMKVTMAATIIDGEPVGEIYYENRPTYIWK